MPQTKTATSTVSLGTWGITGAATAHGAVDEGVDSTDDNTTYVSNSGLAESVLELHIGDPTDPVIHTGHKIRYRARATVGANSTLTIKWMQGTTLIATRSQLLLEGAWQAGNTHLITLTTGEAALITDYTDLRIRFSANADAGLTLLTAVDLIVPTRHEGAGTMSGSSSSSADARKVLSGAGTVAGSASMSGDTRKVLSGAGLLAGAAGMTGGAACTAGAAGTLLGTSALAGRSNRVRTGAGTIPASASLTGSGGSILAGAGTLLGSASLSGAAFMIGANGYWAAANAIRTRFKAQVQDVLALPTQYDNSPSGFRDNATEYLELQAFGKYAVELEGMLQSVWSYSSRSEAGVLHYAPIETGDEDGQELLDVLTAAFRNLKTSRIRYGVPYHVGGRRDGRWWVIEHRIPFSFQQEETPYPIVSGGPHPNAETAANVIRSRFQTLVTAPTGYLTIFDDAPFTAPDNAIWIRFNVLPSLALHTASHLFKQPGLGIAQLFAPIDLGDGDLLALVDTIVPAFRSTSDSGVEFSIPSPTRVGRTDRWWQVNVDVPFFYDRVP